MSKGLHMNDKTSLNQYFSEVDGKKLLNREEEQYLAKMMDAGRWRDENGLLSTNPNKLWDLSKDKETLKRAKFAREKLVRSNLRLVASVAKHYQSKGCELEDLIQEGNIGLIDGIDRFDYRKELKISTYCCWWIRQRIDRLISNHGRTVRVPVHVLTLSHKLSAMFQSYVKNNGYRPSIEEISSELDCTEDMAKQALQVLTKNSIVTIDHSPYLIDDDDDQSLHSVIEDEDAISPLDEISQQELIKSIRQIIKDLPERDEKILRLRFGIVEDPTDHKSWPITEGEIQNLEKRKK
jgi:RNA polymerase primary sigma factor